METEDLNEFQKKTRECKQINGNELLTYFNNGSRRKKSYLNHPIILLFHLCTSLFPEENVNIFI